VNQCKYVPVRNYNAACKDENKMCVDEFDASFHQWALKIKGFMVSNDSGLQFPVLDWWWVIRVTKLTNWSSNNINWYANPSKLPSTTSFQIGWYWLDIVISALRVTCTTFPAFQNQSGNEEYKNCTSDGCYCSCCHSRVWLHMVARTVQRSVANRRLWRFCSVL
jgi:hypothetical protein